MKPLYELGILFIFIIILVILFKDDLIALLVSEGLLLAFFSMVVWNKYEIHLERKTKLSEQVTQADQVKQVPEVMKNDDDEVVDISYEQAYKPSKAAIAKAYEDNTTYVGPKGQVRCLGSMNEQLTRQLQIRGRRDEDNDIAMSRRTADTFRKYLEPELYAHSNRCWWEDNPELEQRMRRDC